MESEDEGVSEETIKANLEMFLPYICDCVQANDLLVHLHYFTREQRKEIFEKSRGRNQEAMKQALDIIVHTRTDPERFRELLEAVKYARYTKVAKMLAGKHIPYDYHCRRIVDLFTPELTGRLPPSELLTLLRYYNVIGQSDSEDIRAEEMNHGRSRASWLLLYYLPCREKNWFKYFLLTLMKRDFNDLARQLDPDLYEKLLIQQNECVDSSMGSLQEEESISLDYARPSKSIDVHENIISDHEYVPPDDNVNAAPKIRSVRADISDAEPQGDTSNLEDLTSLELSEQKEQNVEEYKKQDKGYLDTETEVKMIAEETHVKTLDNFDNLQINTDDLTYSREVKVVVDSASVAADNISDDQLLMDELKVYIAAEEHPNDLSAETRSLSCEEMELNIKTDEDVLDDTEDKDVELRNYQRELAEAGCKGENVIVMAPTNSGKTRVSCAIIQAHMRRRKREGKVGRVIFIVEKEALAGQQGKVCAEQLPAYRTKVFSGSLHRAKQEYLKDFVDRRDILIVTAQILVNALRDKEIETVATFSMIVFDECHHTDSFHPFNKIMSKYMDLKLNNTLHLPQIIGLTASIGVGGNLNQGPAIDHMKRILSNLDASFLCTIRKNVEELKRFERPPIEETVTVDGRHRDIFRVTLENCVDRIKALMAIHPSVANLGGRDKRIKEVFTVPDICGTEQFMQWLSKFKNAIAELSSDAARRVMNPCRHHLEVYNKALMIHRDARVQEAQKMLEFYMQGQDENTVKDDTDKELLKIYESIQTIDYARIPENPKLLKLEHLILDVLQHDPNARGIVFVKTRELAWALIKWTRESQQLGPLNAAAFVGKVASAFDGGMSNSSQKNTLEVFNEGGYKLIIATSVAEEGLDIVKCNLVIRYEHVTNEIARLQSRGRARSKGSKYYVLTETGSWIAEKEEKNAVLEELMKKYVPVVQQEIDTNQNSWQQEMREMQKKAKELELMKEQAQLDKHAGTFLIQCFNCSENICKSTDIRQIQNNHHVVIHDDIRKKVGTVRSPVPKYEEKDFKHDGCVYCLKCVYKLGGVCEYKGIEFPQLKVKQLRFLKEDIWDMNPKPVGQTQNKWKKVPFCVEKFTLDDLSVVVERKKGKGGYENE